MPFNAISVREGASSHAVKQGTAAHGLTKKERFTLLSMERSLL